ncbi:hypothetical protein H072_8339 [Dactylellina haptotyla CBS 200.50]|uniref:Ecp2 effector protein domain-containing protein n=1 Tax=Dactylellina haptotyla (strain CBS 200.50) TaxID=1284197 RepID=S8A4R7_DACHA|nr:hypothetical protein H072_8339 [Dactylellina haptotyla CBS 200.50]
MRRMIAVFFLAIYWFSCRVFAGPVIAGTGQDGKEALDRVHYNLSILDILHHLYGTKVGNSKRDIIRRADGSEYVDASCPGGETNHIDGRVSHCVYRTPIREYNNAIRDLHYKLTRRDVNELGPVYISNSSVVAPARTRRDSRNKRSPETLDQIPDETEPNGTDRTPPLGNSYSWDIDGTGPYCYGSGTWALDSELAGIRESVCTQANNIDNAGFVTQMVYYFIVSPLPERNNYGDKPPALPLRSEAGTIISVNAEITGPMFQLPPPLLQDACNAALAELIWHNCQGRNRDTRGGQMRVAYIPKDAGGVAEQIWMFGVDPQDGDH